MTAVQGAFNRHGGLTLVPMQGYKEVADGIAKQIEKLSGQDGRPVTPVDIATPHFDRRPSGEPYMQLSKHHVGGHDCVVIGGGPGTDARLVELQFLLGYLSARRASRIAVQLGYFPLSRSDKDEGELELALPHFIVNQLVAAAEGKLDRIITFDLHAPQVVMSGRTGLITELSGMREVLKSVILGGIEIGERVVVAFPDDGAQKRYGKILDALEEKYGIDLPSVCGVKRRASAEESTLHQVYGRTGLIKGATVLCIDDESATGGTNIATAAAMKREYGAQRVLAVVTHGVLCGDAPGRFMAEGCPVDRVYCSNTIPVATRAELQPLLASKRLVEVPLTEDMGWAVFNHHWDESIRSGFGQ